MEYIFPLIIVIYSIYIYDYKRRNDKNKKIIFYTLLVYCIILSGLSYRMGIDIVKMYEIEFDYDYPTLSDVNMGYLFYTRNKQPGWLLFASMCKSIVPHFNFMKTIIAIIVNTMMFHTIKKHTPYVFTGILLYFLLIYPYLNFEILRESMAISIFLFSLNYFDKKSWKSYYVCILVAFLFHEGVIVFMALPLIDKIEMSKKRLISFAILAWSIIVFSSLFSWIPETISQIPMFAHKAEKYMNKEFRSSDEFGLVFLLKSFIAVYIPVIGVYYTKKAKMGLNLEFYVIAYVFIYAFSFVFPILFRLQNYLSIFYYIYFIQFLKFFIIKFLGRNNVIKVLLCASYILYIIVPQYFISKERFLNIPLIVKIYPYTSIIDKKVVPEREMLFNAMME